MTTKNNFPYLPIGKNKKLSKDIYFYLLLFEVIDQYLTFNKS